MTGPAGDLRGFARLLGQYLLPHWPAVALLVGLSFVAMGLAALLPLLIAPLLDLAVGSPASASHVTLRGLSLNNLGAAIFQWVGIGASTTASTRSRSSAWPTSRWGS